MADKKKVEKKIEDKSEVKSIKKSSYSKKKIKSICCLDSVNNKSKVLACSIVLG